MFTACTIAFSTVCYSQTLNRQLGLDSLYESGKSNPEPDKAYVHVVSKVPNLRFDSNRLIDKVTQQSSGDWDLWLPPGTHILKISAEGYEMLELPAFNYASKRSYEIKLKARSVYSIVTTPTGAAVLIDDKDTLTSPGRIELDIGVHRVEISKQNCESLSYDVTLPETGLTDEKTLTLLKGSCRLITDPPDADVVIDGRYVGKTPFDSLLALGEHRVQISKANYEELSYRFILDENGLSDTRRLVARLGLYKIATTPVAVEVRIDGADKGKSPLEIDLGLGKHNVQLEKENYVDESYEINLTGNGLRENRELVPYCSDEVGAGWGFAGSFEKNMYKDSTGKAPAINAKMVVNLAYRHNFTSQFAAGVRATMLYVSLSNYEYIQNGEVKTGDLTFNPMSLGLEARWTFSRKGLETYCFLTAGGLMGQLTTESDDTVSTVGGYTLGVGFGTSMSLSKHFAMSFELSGSFGSGSWKDRVNPYSDDRTYNTSFIGASLLLAYRWAGPKDQ